MKKSRYQGIAGTPQAQGTPTLKNNNALQNEIIIPYKIK